MTRHATKLTLVAALFLTAVSGSALAAPCDDQNMLAGKKPHQSSNLKGDVALITDGAMGADGTTWDAPMVVIMEGASASVTYDLGEPRQISALVLQADANDTYKISGSLDDAPGSYKLLTEAPNVVSRGHGLRTRAMEIPTATVRFLKVGDANGDNFFSISELAAYCKKPSPFPPAMKTVAAPGAGAPGTPAPAASNDGGRSFLLLFAAALVLAWLVYRTIRRSSTAAAAAKDEAASTDEVKPPEGPEGPGPTGGAGPGGAA